jgi:hypothetical protein
MITGSGVHDRPDRMFTITGIRSQEHPPGQQALSDFTDATNPGVTIAGGFVQFPSAQRKAPRTRMQPVRKIPWLAGF